MDLAKYTDKKLVVKFSGGREVTGILKGFDQLMNLVLDEVVETVRGVSYNLTLTCHNSDLCTDYDD